MKNLLFILLLLPLIIQAQPYAEIGSGIETVNYRPLLKVAVGYEMQNICLEAVEQVTITRASDASNYFGFKAGYNIKNFVPGIGYYYNYLNADDKSKNHAAPGFSLKYILDLNDNGGMYAEANYFEKTFQISIGFHAIF